MKFYINETEKSILVVTLDTEARTPAETGKRSRDGPKLVALVCSEARQLHAQTMTCQPVLIYVSERHYLKKKEKKKVK